jgi:hypothetical protein
MGKTNREDEVLLAGDEATYAFIGCVLRCESRVQRAHPHRHCGGARARAR